MNEASFASLCPALLARKGGAKPAMRPQLGVIPANQPDGLEDLGWNDMGEDDAPVETGAAVIPINAATANAADADEVSATDPANSKEFENLAERLAQPAAKKTPIGKKVPAAKRGKRAAFTLRLDTDRHLKLRLAATMQNCSAQQLVTEALDLLLADIEDLDTLAAKLSRN